MPDAHAVWSRRRARGLKLVALVGLVASLMETAAAGQEGKTPEQTLASGTWGASQARLDVDAARATLDLPCAHATITGPLRIGDDGRVAWTGRYVAERGGPVRHGARGGPAREPAVAETPADPAREESAVAGVPATYRGRLSGDTLTLTIVVEGRDVGPALVLTRGARARIVKCQ